MKNNNNNNNNNNNEAGTIHFQQTPYTAQQMKHFDQLYSTNKSHFVVLLGDNEIDTFRNQNIARNHASNEIPENYDQSFAIGIVTKFNKNR